MPTELLALLDDELQAVVEAALRAVERTLDSDVAFVSCIEDGTFTIAAAFDHQDMGFEAGRELDLADTFCVRHLVGEAPPRTPDAAAEPAYAEAPARTAFGISSYAVAPIVLEDGTVFGTLCSLDRGAERIAEQDLELLRALARMLAGTLDVRRRHVELEERWLRTVRRLAAIEHRAWEADHDLSQSAAAVRLARALVGEDSAEVLRELDAGIEEASGLLRGAGDRGERPERVHLVQVRELLEHVARIASALGDGLDVSVRASGRPAAGLEAAAVRELLLLLLTDLTPAGDAGQVELHATTEGQQLVIELSGALKAAGRGGDRTAFTAANELAERLEASIEASGSDHRRVEVRIPVRSPTPAGTSR